MKFNIFVIFLVLFTIYGCSSIQVTYDYDQSADFSNYKTFAYSEETLELPLNDINLQRIVDAVNNEMKLKGFTESKDPNIAVDLHIKTQQRVEATANTTGAGYGYRPYRYGWGGGVSTTQISYDQYTDGTLFISFIDMKTKKLVWQGVGTKTIDESMSPEKREQSINYSIKQILSKYPPS